MHTGSGSLTLLYVEKNVLASEAVMPVLERLGLQVTHKTRFAPALEAFRLRPHDIVLASLPDSGIDVAGFCRDIRSVREETSVVLVGAPEAIAEAVDLGVDGFLTYPLDAAKLEWRLRRETEKFVNSNEVLRARHMIEEYLKVFDTSVIFSKTNPQGIITYANDAFVEISGYSRDELIGRPHSIIRHPDTPRMIFKELWETIKSGQIWKGIIANRSKDGSDYLVESTIIPILDPEGRPIEYLGIRYDITDKPEHTIRLQDVARENERIAMKRSKELMERLYVDNNTNLPNNLALHRDIDGFRNGALLLLDVNNFNIFNKLNGFEFGDELLRSIGEHLRFLLRENERVYKLGSDRYVVLSEESQTEGMEQLCNQIFAYFDNFELSVGAIECQVSFSIGVAKIVAGHDTIIDAEFALDVAKRHGKRMRVIYDEHSEEFVNELDSISWLNRTREFIYKDLIVPYYQPIVDVATREVYKYEALARVVDGQEVIPPHRFLGAALRLGMLTSVTKSMIEKTFAEFSGTDTCFSINITERDIMDGYLVEFIKHKVGKYDIDPRQVTFEVLENLTLSQEGELVEKTIALVKDYGCNIAIDDFGSENSNFGRILSLQSDYLKIDGFFVRGCDVAPEKQKIINAIVQLARRLDIRTIAEYVESEAVYETIRELGVDYAQGYLFGEPRPMQSDAMQCPVSSSKGSPAPESL